ncbi:DUF3995 domain-containing protein [Phenylobacterium sp.]|uniref:DUF3995 domain-containing protein n=1 Tax=Phenylobacterium sp. TaxID=1871053 RepID=UPI0035615006
MIGPLAIGLTAVVAAIGLLHLAWGLGLRWPGTDEASLAALVVGRTRGGRMPSRPLTVLVAAAILAAAGLVLAVSAPGLPTGLFGLALAGYIAVDLVFLARGVAGFVPAVWRYAEGTPFHRLNQLYYSPLCLLIAAGFTANLFFR